jgi:putative membrane protein
MGILIRLAVSAFALWLSTLVFEGITVDSDSLSEKVITIVLVAIMFGIANAVLRPIIKMIGCWAYVLTLGLVALVVNGALFLLTSWIAGQLDLPFHVDKFWPTAVLGALFIAIVSWLLNFLVPDGGDKKSKSRPAPPRQQYPPQYPGQYRGR